MYNLPMSAQLTFILVGSRVLSNRPSQNILRYDQRTYEQQKAMLDK